MKYTRIYRPATIVFDMDGTLVDDTSVKPLVEESLRTHNFDAFHEASLSCPSIPWVVEHAREAHKMGLRVIQVTARQERYRPITSLWITKHGVPSDALYMRRDGDYRPDYEVKKEILDRILPTHNIVKAFDDNPSIVSLWAEYDVPCVVVPGWEG